MPGAVRGVHPALRECLAGPIVGYDLVLDAQAVHLGIPSPSATVIIAFDAPLDVGWLADPSLSARRWVSVSGLHLRPALVRTHGLQRGIQLAVTPVGCRALFGAPLSALAGQTVDMVDLPRGLTGAEHDRLSAVGCWGERLALLEEQLLARLRPARPPEDVVHAWRLLTTGRSVEQTAATVGWSRRHLLTRVRAESGLSPKQVGRLARFHRVRALVRAGTPLAEAAYAGGYADQPHLSREWKTFSGRSPTASDDDFPNLHDIVPAPRTDSSHD